MRSESKLLCFHLYCPPGGSIGKERIFCLFDMILTFLGSLCVFKTFCNLLIVFMECIHAYFYFVGTFIEAVQNQNTYHNGQSFIFIKIYINISQNAIILPYKKKKAFCFRIRL